MKTHWSVLVIPLVISAVLFVGPLVQLFIISLREPSQTELYGGQLVLYSLRRGLKH